LGNEVVEIVSVHLGLVKKDFNFEYWFVGVLDVSFKRDMTVPLHRDMQDGYVDGTEVI